VAVDEAKRRPKDWKGRNERQTLRLFARRVIKSSQQDVSARRVPREYAIGAC